MKIIKASPYIILFFSAIFIACQTGPAHDANGRPLIDKDNYRKINITYADTTSPQARQLIATLDSYYNAQVLRGFNGSVLLGQKGKILYKRYFGMANRSANLPLSSDISSQLASTSKPFTATAVLWLYQNKYLDIELPVNVYLKDFPYSNVTVKMMLDQRSGLPDYTKVGLPKWAAKAPMYNIDLQRYIATYKPKLMFTPNTRFNYSNTNYALLARIIEEVSGMSYKQFMQELIFDPLGMTHTFVYDPKDDYSSRKLTTSYKFNWAVHDNTHEDGVYGDKGIYSTVEDMYRWDQSFYNNDILSDKMQHLAITGCSNEMKGMKNYGLGWRMYDFENGRKLVYHNGWWHGNNTVFYRYIQDNTTVIVLGNRFNSKIYEQGKDVYQILKRFSKDCVYSFGKDTVSEE
ncbi:serine hydrolase [Taibaiella sp. KBW10]|uniref:serine hydrolase domain-containing protein n=1 Tax=Taibaiella sp. KBW10 TaxID=2153357 RepID=UPI0013157F93|nr:serine hydrolase domain-containing protein [Taibaiella sp. KBW10]